MNLLIAITIPGRFFYLVLSSSSVFLFAVDFVDFDVYQGVLQPKLIQVGKGCFLLSIR